MSKVKVAINGFGRIGRAFFKLAWDRDDIEIVALNDLGDEENLAYLLKYDTVYGKWPHEVEARENAIAVDGKEIPFLQEKDPTKLPWGDMDVDVALESTGVFRHYKDAKMHLDAGAKKVVISAPAKGEPVEGVESATILMGVNEDKFKTCQISSNGSCTTNAASPVITILNETIGIEKAMLNTVHGYTASQNLIDGPHKDFRRGRAAAQNIVPTTTGAAIAVTEAVTELAGKFDGMAMRVPTIIGSIADITLLTKRDTTEEEINDIFRKAVKEDRWQGVLKVTDEQIVSTDIAGELYGAIVDTTYTKVVDGNLVKVISWYDNEMGYTNTLVRHVIEIGKNVS